MKTQRHTLKKSDILRGYRAYSRAISSGRTLQKGPIRCFYLVEPGSKKSFRIGFAVSRAIRRAVARNKVRRWMKESYRQKANRPDRDQAIEAGQHSIVFLYSGRTVPVLDHQTRSAIDQAIASLLNELRQRFL